MKETDYVLCLKKSMTTKNKTKIHFSYHCVSFLDHKNITELYCEVKDQCS